MSRFHDDFATPVGWSGHWVNFILLTLWLETKVKRAGFCSLIQNKAFGTSGKGFNATKILIEN